MEHKVKMHSLKNLEKKTKKGGEEGRSDEKQNIIISLELHLQITLYLLKLKIKIKN